MNSHDPGFSWNGSRVQDGLQIIKNRASGIESQVGAKYRRGNYRVKRGANGFFINLQASSYDSQSDRGNRAHISAFRVNNETREHRGINQD